MLIVQNGTHVCIKKKVDSWAAGEWGFVVDYDEGNDEYHIAVTYDTDMVLVFKRDEFTVKRAPAKDAHHS